MRLIIAGGRDYENKTGLYKLAHEILKGESVKVIINGGAIGADQLGRQYALDHRYKLETYIADWDKYGLKAGPMRNRLMAQKADVLLACWDGQSKGTKNMITEAKKAGLKIIVLDY